MAPRAERWCADEACVCAHVCSRRRTCACSARASAVPVCVRRPAGPGEYSRAAGPRSSVCLPRGGRTRPPGRTDNVSAAGLPAEPRVGRAVRPRSCGHRSPVRRDRRTCGRGAWRKAGLHGAGASFTVATRRARCSAEPRPQPGRAACWRRGAVCARQAQALPAVVAAVRGARAGGTGWGWQGARPSGLTTTPPPHWAPAEPPEPRPPASLLPAPPG